MESKTKMPPKGREALSKLNNIISHACFSRKEEAEELLQIVIRESIKQESA